MSRLIAPLLCVAALCAVPHFVSSPYALHLFILLFSSIALGGAWNLIGGWAGQYSVGHAAYFGIGAYTTVILLTRRELAPWLSVFPAALLCAAVAILIGSICFRLRGPYFVLASIAVAEIIRLTALNWNFVTNGAEGILASDLPPLTILGHTLTDFSSKTPFYYWALLLATLATAVNALLRRVPLGFRLQAIREDQDAAASLGIDVGRAKNTALIISAILTGLVGSFYGVYVGFIDPGSVLGLDLSVQIVLVCIIGGVGTVYGPLLGALVLVPLDEGLRANLLADGLFKLGLNEASPTGVFLRDNLAHAHVLIYGILIVLVILFMPDGVLGFAAHRLRRIGR